jgi:hypothetical protein
MPEKNLDFQAILNDGVDTTNGISVNVGPAGVSAALPGVSPAEKPTYEYWDRLEPSETYVYKPQEIGKVSRLARIISRVNRSKS